MGSLASYRSRLIGLLASRSENVNQEPFQTSWTAGGLLIFQNLTFSLLGL